MLVSIANREDPDQTAPSELLVPSQSRSAILLLIWIHCVNGKKKQFGF